MLRALSPLLQDGEFRPHLPVSPTGGIFVSQFGPAGCPFGLAGNCSAWLGVERDGGANVSAAVLQLPCAETRRFYAIYTGQELKHVTACSVDGQGGGGGRTVELGVPVEASGYLAVLAVDEGGGNADLTRFLAARALLTATPLGTYRDTWTPVQQELLPPDPPQPSAAVRSIAEAKALSALEWLNVSIPDGSAFNFTVRDVQVEACPLPEDKAAFAPCEDRPAWYTGVQFPWEHAPQSRHSHTLLAADVPAFRLMRYPVTNDDYTAFLSSTGWRPPESEGTLNWLRHWDQQRRSQTRYGAGGRPSRPRAATGRQPVRWVSRDDAAAYCHWTGGRLPHDWEWQLAAQGTNDGVRRFPWGNDWDGGAHVPALVFGGTAPEPENVTAHPDGASPFGAEDLVGNVWQWTDAFADPHTTRALLRGGSRYQPGPENATHTMAYWYFAHVGAYWDWSIQKHNYYRQTSAGIDRSGTVGFRCASDAGQI